MIFILWFKVRVFPVHVELWMSLHPLELSPNEDATKLLFPTLTKFLLAGVCCLVMIKVPGVSHSERHYMITRGLSERGLYGQNTRSQDKLIERNLADCQQLKRNLDF